MYKQTFYVFLKSINILHLDTVDGCYFDQGNNVEHNKKCVCNLPSVTCKYVPKSVTKLNGLKILLTYIIKIMAELEKTCLLIVELLYNSEGSCFMRWDLEKKCCHGRTSRQ